MKLRLNQNDVTRVEVNKPGDNKKMVVNPNRPSFVPKKPADDSKKPIGQLKKPIGDPNKPNVMAKKPPMIKNQPIAIKNQPKIPNKLANKPIEVLKKLNVQPMNPIEVPKKANIIPNTEKDESEDACQIM